MATTCRANTATSSSRPWAWLRWGARRRRAPSTLHGGIGARWAPQTGGTRSPRARGLLEQESDCSALGLRTGRRSWRGGGRVERAGGPGSGVGREHAALLYRTAPRRWPNGAQKARAEHRSSPRYDDVAEAARGAPAGRSYRRELAAPASGRPRRAAAHDASPACSCAPRPAKTARGVLTRIEMSSQIDQFSM